MRVGGFGPPGLPNDEECFLILLTEVERKEVLLDSTLKNVLIYF